jgi:non-specific serine/threonine protein kinase
LATQVAAELLDQFPQGVWFIELSSISDATLVLKDIATTLGIREEGNESLATTLTEALRHRKLLIIFDNCEHLIDACAKAAELLLRACPDVKILCTSREPLNISGEQTYRVPSLSLPNPKGNITPERLNQYEAVRLFIERAVQTRSDFVVTNQNAPALASLCARLDGIPLAIELAAARVRSLSVEEIEARLKDAFRLLTGGSRTALPRQQTLRAAIDWSYELLTPVEQTLLRRLAVFIGGWTLEAAEQVCSGAGDGVSIDDWEVLDLLSGLADRSLVAVEELKEGSRYRLLETVRQYSSEKLLASGEIGAISEAHLQWAVRFAEEASTHLAGAEQVLWMNRLETEHDNIRTALRLAFAAPYRVTEAMRLVGSLRRFWGIRGYWSEGLSHLATALALPGADTPNIARAEALNTAGVMAMLQGDFDQAYTYLWESEQLAKNLKEDTVRASSLLNLGNVARDRGQYEEAFSFYSEGIAVSQHLGNRAREANCRQMFGRALSDLGRFAEAQEQFEKALQVSRETGDRFSEAVVLDNLGALGVRQSHLPTARDYYNQALAVAQEIGYREEYLCWLSGMGAIADKEGDAEKACSYYLQALDEAKEIGSKQGIGFTLAMLAVVWVRQGKFAPAIRLYGFEETLRERIGYRIPPLEQKICEGAQQIAREQLGEKAYQSEYQTGATMNTDAVLHYTRNY